MLLAFALFVASCPFVDEPALREVAKDAGASVLVVGRPGMPLTRLELTLRNDTSPVPLLVVDCHTGNMVMRCPGQRVGMDCAARAIEGLAENVEPLEADRARTVKTGHVLRGVRNLCETRACEPWTARHEHVSAAGFWVIFTGCVVYWRQKWRRSRLQGALRKAK